jgi:uncharacterized protein YgbK (DUF1537 family)
MSSLRISFYGDDFTGSTDAMESLALAGLRTILFTAPPTRETLSQYPDLQAFGIAGTTRSMAPDEMERALRPVFESLRQSGAPIIHYKVCSTFDSSPQIGSIGRAIDVGFEMIRPRCVPVLVAAPSLGRYCIFGNLFARFGTDGEIFRLDRHPSVSQHPVTPMLEADLRLHLAQQTSKSIGLLNTLELDRAQWLPWGDSDQVILIDLLHEEQLAKVGQLIAQLSPCFVVGSSGVESALSAHWKLTPHTFSRVAATGPIIAVCGSCSPVTAGQIGWAMQHGFEEVRIGDDDAMIRASMESLQNGRSVAIHSNAVRKLKDASDVGPRLGRVLRNILDGSAVRRVIVAGGDTSGHIARELGIESMEMIGELTRGSPLCRITAPGSPADGIEMTFKGGQIGPVDFFGRVQQGF